MGFLYINAKGKPWSRHSYSAGNTFDKCPYKYYLQKILGWREKNQKARFELGRAFESAIQFYHENWGDRDAAIKHFLGQWEPFKAQALQYTRVEKDWDTCARIAVDWLKLYAIRQPSLPIPIGGEPEHPLLPKLIWRPEYGAFRPVIVDIKTAGQDFPDAYGIAAYDAQLRRYSWLTGIRDAALLWFVKKGLKIAKGYSVTLLEDAGFMKAGQEAVVAMVEDDGIWLLQNDFMIGEMERAQGQKNGKTEQTKEAKARRDAWLEENGTWATEEGITKQRLQFNAGFITTESAEDAGKIAQNQIVRIVTAWQNDNWPNTFGIRYPSDDRSDPYFQAFVLNNKMYKEQNFTKSDDDIDLFAEDEPDAEE